MQVTWTVWLSLLLACLILSGVLSWLNSRGVSWRLVPPPSLRAGQEAPVGLELHNGKKFLPTHGLAFSLVDNPVDRSATAGPARAKARGRPVREILFQAEKSRVRTRLFQRGRRRCQTDPGLRADHPRRGHQTG